MTTELEQISNDNIFILRNVKKTVLTAMSKHSNGGINQKIFSPRRIRQFGFAYSFQPAKREEIKAGQYQVSENKKSSLETEHES